MKGNIRVVITTKKLRYDLNLRRNITVIQGDSGTGKTTLVKIVEDYERDTSIPGIEVVCEKKCMVLSGNKEDCLERMKKASQAVIFVDENEKFIHSKEFARTVLESDCYFVFVTREKLDMLPYSVEEIYQLRNSGYYQNTKQIYNEMQQIYPNRIGEDVLLPTVVLTEDSNAGYQMYSELLENAHVPCVSAYGKSNIAKWILLHKEESVFAIVDGAAYGADMEETMRALRINKSSFVWTPESFEYLIMKSEIVQGSGWKDILESPGEYIESKEYPSWERYFTRRLEEETANTVYEYSKNKINQKYLTKGNMDRFKSVLPGILKRIVSDNNE